MNWIRVGALARHRRGRVLEDACGASPGELPASGGAMAVGEEYQRDEPARARWTSWCSEPGRVLLLLPPFDAGPCPQPTPWAIESVQDVVADEPLASLLSREAPSVVTGVLQSRADWRWRDGRPHTALHRRHPHAGGMVITTLALWSVLVLDHEALARDWLVRCAELAGEPAPVPAVETGRFQPARAHFTVLLHLLTGPYPDAEAALRTLASSGIFHLSTDSARVLLSDLQRAGLADGGAVSSAGVRLLETGPYAPYAAALRPRQT